MWVELVKNGPMKNMWRYGEMICRVAGMIDGGLSDKHNSDLIMSRTVKLDQVKHIPKWWLSNAYF